MHPAPSKTKRIQTAVLDKAAVESRIEINVVSKAADRLVMPNKLCCADKPAYCSRGVKITLQRTMVNRNKTLFYNETEQTLTLTPIKEIEAKQVGFSFFTFELNYRMV